MSQLANFSFVATLFLASIAFAQSPEQARQEIEAAMSLTPNPDNGRRVYLLCAVCHMPEGWGEPDGSYPQIAGQHYSVIIKQLADIRARNRDTPTMLPFAMLEHLSIQDLADVAAYITRLPMTRDNTVGPGDDLDLGQRLYEKYCADCHGDRGEGVAEKHMPLIQGQQFPYLVRQFEWIRDGKRRNGDPDMIDQIKGFSDRDIAAIMDYVARLRPPAERLAAEDWRNPDFPQFQRPKPPSLTDAEGL